MRIGLSFVEHHHLGIDLRASFPCVSQREGTYKPPEIVATGFSDKFGWSRFIAEFGGNVLQTNVILASVEPADTWIVDIEQDPRELRPFLLALPSNITLILRIQCCRDWVQYFYDALSCNVLYCTSVNGHLKVKSYILIAKNFQHFNVSANYQRCVVLSEPLFTSNLVKDTKHATDLLNLMVKPYGQNCKVISAPELDRISSHLRRRTYYMTNDLERLKMLDLAISLEKIAYYFRNIDSITSNDIISMSPTVRRLLGRWLANTALPLDNVRSLCNF